MFTVKEWQDNWDSLMARVENGEHIGIVNEEGKTAVMIPADDAMIKMYTEHNEGS